MPHLAPAPRTSQRTLLVTLAGVLALVLSTAAPHAQQPAADLFGAPNPGNRVDTRHLTATVSASPLRGGRATLFVDVTPKPRMHVYAPEQKDVIPVSLTIEAIDGVRAGQPRLPPAQTYFFEPLNETQAVYSKPFRIAQPITVAAAARGVRPLTVKGTLRYQACDEAICYVPQAVAVRWVVGE